MKMALLLGFVILMGFVSSVQAQDGDFNTADLRRIASLVGFKGVKTLKTLSESDMMQFYTKIEADRALMKQLNINGWGVCEHYNIDNFDTYNYYYNDIARDTYTKYCKELNALMLLDETLAQLR